MGYGIDILPNERDALGEIFDLALGDQENYQQDGNPHSDYGDEWPEAARGKAKTWREAAKLAKRLGWTETVKRCHQLARNLEASAKEYRELHEATNGD